MADVEPEEAETLTGEVRADKKAALLAVIQANPWSLYCSWGMIASVQFRVVDPYSFFTDPDPDPIRIQGFNDQKLKKKL